MLNTAINKSIRKNIFPKSRKIALVAPIDKEKLNKSKISNFKSVGVLNTVSKLYEKIMKNS